MRTLWQMDSFNLFYATLPALFAKSSMVWTPLFYLLSNGHIKEAIIEVFFKRKPVIKQDS